MTNDNRPFSPDDRKKLQKALKEAQEEFAKNNEDFAEALKVSRECFAEQFQQVRELRNFVRENNEFVTFREFINNALGPDTEHISNKYAMLRDGVNSSSHYTQQQKDAFNLRFNEAEQREKDEAFSDSLLGGAAEDMSDEFSKGLSDMIRGYRDFSDVLRQMTASLTDYLIKSFTDALGQMIFAKGNMEGLLNLGGGILSWAGGVGAGIGGFLGNIFKHHSGGIIPSGASYSLPGTQEQLALLKGGERVLSPSENSAFEDSNSSSPVIFNNFNIKAWDSKDVKKYLLENKQLLNSITYEGIKNNNSHLRNMVRNA